MTFDRKLKALSEDRILCPRCKVNFFFPSKRRASCYVCAKEKDKVKSKEYEKMKRKGYVPKRKRGQHMTGRELWTGGF